MIPVERVLDKLNDLPTDSVGRQTFVFTDSETGLGVAIDFEQVEALAARAWEVTLTPCQRPQLLLAERAKALASRITGLLEPMAVLEVDDGVGVAVLRSQPPTAKAADRFYHEALLTREGKTTLRRYKGSMQVAGRQQVSFTITREALAKLISDLAG